jgi:thiol-disulfide isomerase/thioredoxin
MIRAPLGASEGPVPRFPSIAVRLVALVMLAAAACRRPDVPAQAPAVPPARAALPAPASEPEPASGPASGQGAQLGFTVHSPNGDPVPAYASMDPGAPIAFEAENGSGGVILGSSVFEKDGRHFTYWHVDSESGTGWIWEKHLVIHARTQPIAAAPIAAAPEPARRRAIAMDVDVVAHDDARAGAGGVETPAAPAPIRGSDAPDVLQVNGGGDEVTLASHLVPGQHVVFDFYSVHCGPCMRLAPQLEALAGQSPIIVLRKVDIDRPGSRGIDWQSPVARQHGLRSIPWLKVYGPDGDLEAEGPAALAALEQIARGG